VESSATQNNRPLGPLSNNTLRQPIHVSIGGKKVRLHLSNLHGGGPLEIKKAHLAVSTGTTKVDDKIDVATDKELLFSGKATVTIAAKQEVVSDPLDFELAPLSNLAITILFGATPADTTLTGHPGSRTSYYLVDGDAVSSAGMTGAKSAAHWYFISELDVMADANTHAVAIIGDSITDGRDTTDNGNDRWTDVLAKRLQTAGKKVGVLNQGAGGNQVLTGGGLGTPAVTRFDHDVIQPAGARWAIVFEGVNDINAGATSTNLINAYKGFITKAHAANMKIFGATITPFNGNSYYTAPHEQVRTDINKWIRETTPANGGYDGVIDMDKAVRDSSDPTKITAAYTTDGLHCTPAGYAKMGEEVSLSFFDP
jgi:lysophospholipase L1-like esterase